MMVIVLMFDLRERKNFTITVQIFARSLANFIPQYADRHMNLQIPRCGNER